MKRKKSEEAIVYLGNDRKRIERTVFFVIADIVAVLIATIGALWVRFDFSFQDMIQFRD